MLNGCIYSRLGCISGLFSASRFLTKGRERGDSREEVVLTAEGGGRKEPRFRQQIRGHSHMTFVVGG